MANNVLQLGDGYPHYSPHLKDEVKQLQQLLQAWGYPIVVTGYFDWATDQAVLDFQRKQNLSADAKVGSGTWAKLRVKPSPIGSSFSTVTLADVPFIHQFDGVHVPGHGQTACFKAASTMLKAVGVKDAGPAKRIQIVKSEKWENGKRATELDAVALKTALSYIDNELGKKRPVMVGVSYAAGNHGNVDGITEHFVTIVDKNASGNYVYHDPATESEKKGAYRIFSFDAISGNLIAPGEGSSGVVALPYEVTMVRRNEP